MWHMVYSMLLPPGESISRSYHCEIVHGDTIPTKNGRELMEKWVSELKDKFLGPNWQRMLSCAYTTQLLHSTGEVCWNNKDSYFIWFEICVLKVGTNSFQEVLKAVLFGVGVYLQQLTFWLFCGSPIRVSTTFILREKLILFALARISNNV